MDLTIRKATVRRIVAVVLLLAISSIVPTLIQGPIENTLDATSIARSASVQYWLVGVYGFAAGILLLKLREHANRQTILNARVIFLLPLAAICSIAWSVQPAVTAQRAMGVVGSVLVGIVVGLLVRNERDLVVLILILTTVVAGVSLVLGGIYPEFAYQGGTLHSPARHLRGVAGHKNALGHIAALGVAVWILSRGSEGLFLRALGVGVTGLALLLSGSTGATLALAAGLAVGLALDRVSAANSTSTWIPKLTGSAIVVSGLLLPLAMTGGFGPEPGRFGPDPAGIQMNGRLEIWSLSLDRFAQRPILGEGFGLWADLFSQASPLWPSIRSAPTTAHNAYLELGIGLGVLGLAVLLYLAVVALIKTGQGSRHRVLRGIVLLLLFSGIAESSIVRAHSWMLALLVCIVVMRCQPRVVHFESSRYAAALSNTKTTPGPR